MNIDKSIWGKHIWFTLHYISLGYPDNPNNNDKEKYKAFFFLIKDILPCKICANHYNENLIKMPLTDKILSDKELFIRWVIDLHNTVNQIIGKEILDYDSAKKLIIKNINCDHNNISNNYFNFYILALIIIIIICLIIYRNYY